MAMSAASHRQQCIILSLEKVVKAQWSKLNRRTRKKTSHYCTCHVPTLLMYTPDDAQHNAAQHCKGKSKSLLQKTEQAELQCAESLRQDTGQLKGSFQFGEKQATSHRFLAA